METKQITEINGVILTPVAFQALKNLQEYDNSMINRMAEKMADINDYFARELHMSPAMEDVEIKKLINELSYIRQYIKDLRKP